MKEYKVPGVTLSIVKDGKMILAKGYGFSDIENQKIVNPKKPCSGLAQSANYSSGQL